MPSLTMKETPSPSDTQTETRLEEQIRWRAYQLYEARCRERQRLGRLGSVPKSTSLGMPHGAPQRRTAQPRIAHPRTSPAYQPKEAIHA